MFPKLKLELQGTGCVWEIAQHHAIYTPSLYMCSDAQTSPPQAVLAVIGWWFLTGVLVEGRHLSRMCLTCAWRIMLLTHASTSFHPEAQFLLTEPPLNPALPVPGS